MKIIVLSAVFVFCVFNLFAQEMKLRLFKESHKIDSLFDRIIPKSDTGHSYFGLHVLYSDNECSLIVSQQVNKGSNIYWHFMAPDYMKYFGYFTYKGKIVLVNSNAMYNGFFEVSIDSRSFNFIQNNPEVYDGMYHLYYNEYFYEDGIIKDFGPKLLKQLNHHSKLKDSLKN